MRCAAGSRLIVVLVLLAGATAGCGVTRGDDSRDLLMIIPNGPGGGYDQTGRAAVAVMEDADITGGSFTVDNVVGAGGAGAMTSLVGRAGDEHTMMTVGLGVVGSTYSFASEYSLQDATPLAQLMSEPEGGVRARRLFVPDHRRPGRGMEGGSRLALGGRRLVARRAGSPVPHAAGR